MATSDKHKQLQETAIQWLHGVGCSVFAKEVPTENGVADALGIKTKGKHAVYYIEAKQSRSDLICQKQKACYARSVGSEESLCFYHTRTKFPDLMGVNRNKEMSEGCPNCAKLKAELGDTGIDFYYLIVADGIKVEDNLYPTWGVIGENGKIIRKAKRMKREKSTTELIVSVAHVLVYKVFGKLYFL